MPSDEKAAASPETMALAQQYLEKHRVPEEQFGLRPFLENESSLFVLLAHMQTQFDGSLVFDFFGKGYSDCRTIAERIYDDIMATHPELNPKIAGYRDKGVHNWVEITDPRTGASVQIDATPWYNCLNPGHAGEEAKSDMRTKRVAFSSDRSPPFSVKTIGESTITVYLFGCLPGCKMQRNAAAPRALENGTKMAYNEPDAAYRFILRAVLAPHFGDEPEKTLAIYLDVKDIGKTFQMLHGKKGIPELLKSGAVEMGIHIYGLPGGLGDIPVPPGLEYLKQVAGEDKAELFSEIERCLPAMEKLLRLANAILRYCDNPNMELCVPSNMPTMKLREDLPRFWPRNPPSFKLIPPEMKNKFSGALSILPPKQPA